jgi:hypothetical protein
MKRRRPADAGLLHVWLTLDRRTLPIGRGLSHQIMSCCSSHHSSSVMSRIRVSPLMSVTVNAGHLDRVEYEEPFRPAGPP